MKPSTMGYNIILRAEALGPNSTENGRTLLEEK
jgi:hypothetical protein